MKPTCYRVWLAVLALLLLVERSLVECGTSRKFLSGFLIGLLMGK